MPIQFNNSPSKPFKLGLVLVAFLMGSDSAYVTLLTSLSYLAGVLVLNQSLRQVKSRYKLVVMVTPALPENARKVLRRQRITIIEVESLSPPQGKHKLHTQESRFVDTWTKLRCAAVPGKHHQTLTDRSRSFGLVEYKVLKWRRISKRCTEDPLSQRIILLDSDMIILKNMDALMDTDLRGHHIGAVHVCACNPRGFQHYPRDW